MENNLRFVLNNYLELGKIKIMLPVSLTAFTGYFLYKPVISTEIILISLGILILAVSSSALNQIQEIGIDSKMSRTRNRPLPSGKIKVRAALVFFAVSFILGLSIIYFAGNLTAALLGVFTVIWYNGVYTYSKRLTAFAVVPGALTGALPPLTGWVAAGGAVTDKPVILLGFLLFIGQVPHFWLLIMKYGEDYENAGVPSLTKTFSRNQINRLTFTWVVVSVISAFFLAFSGMIRSGIILIILSASSLFLLIKFTEMLKEKLQNISYQKYFILLNSYFLLILLLLIADRIIH